MTTGRLEIVKRIKENPGKIFTAVFIKKDGTERTMTCRLGVAKYVTSEGMKYNPFERGLLPVFDMQKEEYRMININTLKSITVAGETLAVAS